MTSVATGRTESEENVGIPTSPGVPNTETMDSGSSISATVYNIARVSVVGSDSDITETHVSGRSDVVGVVGGEVGSGMGQESGSGSSTTRAPDSSIVRPL